MNAYETLPACQAGSNQTLENRLDNLLEQRRKSNSPGLNRSQHIRDLLTIGLEHYERNRDGQVS